MEVRFEQAANGEPTALLDGRYLHSRHNPGREAERSTRGTVQREPPCVVIVGSGLGYHARSILERTSRTHVIAFEPVASVREHSEGPLAALPAELSGRLALVGSTSALSDELGRSARGGFERVPLRTGDTDPSLREAEEIVASFADRLEINRNTLQKFGRLWVRNLSRNIHRLASSVGVRDLAGLFEGVPCLILAAGPTLDQVLPSLPALADRLLVIAVDTAIRPALDAGVEPDFAVVVDPQYWNSRHLDRVRPGRTLLVSEPSAQSSIFRRFRSPQILCTSLFPLGAALEHTVGSFGTLGAGGSVATTAWDFANLLGCSSAFAAGLDLGFPESRTHVKGSFFEHLAVARADRTQTAERVVFRYTWGANPHPIESTTGGTVLSDRRMAVYLNWFSSQIGRGMPTRLLTRGGAAIEGVTLSSLDEALRLPIIRDLIDERVGRIEPRPEDESGERLSALRGPVSDIVDGMRHLKEVGEEALAIVRTQANTPDDEPIDLSALEALDRRIGSHRFREIASFLMQEVITRIDHGYGSAGRLEHLTASEELYAALVRGAVDIAESLEASAGTSLE